MRSIISFAALVAFASAAPATAPPANAPPPDYAPDGVYFPLKDTGFPDPDTNGKLNIAKAAFGPLPNGGAPPSISEEGFINLRLIALNELFEVAFFSELLYNVKYNATKFDYDLGYGQDYVVDALEAIVAQEEQHALNANGALKAKGKNPIQACKYNFPVQKFHEAIALAGLFTDLVMSTLQDVNQIFAQNGDAGLVRGVSSVIAEEGEQEGFYRLIQKKRPTSQAFVTGGTRDFAFSALQQVFIVPGSCPNIHEIDLQTFKPLTVVTQNIKNETQNLKFSFSKKDAGTSDWTSLKTVFLNSQTTPIIKDLQNVQVSGDMVTFEAAFPFDEFLMNGLTIAAVTHAPDASTNNTFANADQVSGKTIFGPGLIEIN